MHRTTIDYDHLKQKLQQAGVDCDPAWLHGALFGLIALHDDRHDAVCEGLGQAVEGLGILEKEIEALYRDTWQALDGPGLDFGMLLPPESSSLEARAKGLVNWTTGYIEGLRCGGLDESRFPTPMGARALEELRQLAETPVTAFAEEDESFHEAVEHAWITAVLVREFLVVTRERQDRASEQSDPS